MILRTSCSLIAAAALTTWGALSASAAGSCEGVNVLTPAEKAAGWELLFDGKTMGGWHGYNGQARRRGRSRTAP